MRPLVTFTVVLMSTGAYACGTANTSKDARHILSHPSSTDVTVGTVLATTLSARGGQRELPRDSDNDNDNPVITGRDEDDGPLLRGSLPADASDRRAITMVVKRYYSAGAAGDGSITCSLLYPDVARSIPEDYGRPPGPPALRGSTCAAVMSKLLAQRRRELIIKNARLEVVAVRIAGGRAVALLRFTETPERRVFLRRDHDVWKMSEMFDVVAMQ